MCHGPESVPPVGASVLIPPDFTKPVTLSDDFYWVGTDEPHATRRKAILKKYPEIKKLFGHCPKTKYIVIALVIAQTYVAYQSQFVSWPIFHVLTYVVGATMVHSLVLAMHELAHNLGFKKLIHNRLFSLIVTMPLVVPSAVSFQMYHLDHHRYLGHDGLDMDLPSALEGRLVTSISRKLLFMWVQMIVYSLRPVLLNPKPIRRWHVYSALTNMVYLYFVHTIAGWSGLLYLSLSLFWSGSLHPLAAHFIAEHYVFTLGHETYSYYGILNYISFNVGYHNEHHDFPFIPGSRLPLVRKIASEFYDTLPYHTSWSKVIYDYITDQSIGATSRVKRNRADNRATLRLKLP